MAEFEGKQGRWITTKTGRHVFVEKGKTVEEALGEAFEEYNYDKEKKYGIEGWSHTSLYDTEKERQKAYHGYSDKEFEFDLDYDEAFKLLNDPNLSEQQLIRKLGDLFGEYGEGNNYALGARILNQYLKDDYNNIINQRELKNFAPRIQAAEDYLSTMPKINMSGSRLDDDITINEGANFHNYREAERVYKYGFDRQGNYNPGQAKKDYDAFTSNCQRCVMAWFLRLKGYDVEACEYDGEEPNGGYNWNTNPSNYRLLKAAPSIKRDDGYVRRNWSFSGFNVPKNSMFDYNGKNKQWASTQYKEITKMAQDAGPGAVYFCSVKWRGHNSAHVFVIHNNRGTVEFFDPQDNSSASKYFDPKQYGLVTEDTTVKRVDNLTLNGDILKDIVKKREIRASMEDKVWKKI